MRYSTCPELSITIEEDSANPSRPTNGLVWSGAIITALLQIGLCVYWSAHGQVDSAVYVQALVSLLISTVVTGAVFGVDVRVPMRTVRISRTDPDGAVASVHQHFEKLVAGPRRTLVFIYDDVQALVVDGSDGERARVSFGLISSPAHTWRRAQERTEDDARTPPLRGRIRIAHDRNPLLVGADSTISSDAARHAAVVFAATREADPALDWVADDRAGADASKLTRQAHVLQDDDEHAGTARRDRRLRRS